MPVADGPLNGTPYQDSSCWLAPTVAVSVSGTPTVACEVDVLNATVPAACPTVTCVVPVPAGVSESPEYTTVRSCVPSDIGERYCCSSSGFVKLATSVCPSNTLNVPVVESLNT
ncbi:hypothetical protein BPA30113_07568 [Burkholderia paludis]|uniref:Uncharacterized protein n=1 Tax=Burkholderia paludis TaxID=1506587 RepID=A0A6P2SS87_9BURK|nr:hypothetical protein BPA30113_07568 [Burkholderia paludis]